MIIEFKMLNKTSSASSLTMDLNMNNWYFDELVNSNILLHYDDLSQNMKDYIFDKGNIRDCIISNGSMFDNAYKKYIFTPTLLARFEITNNNIFDLKDGEILFNHEDFKYVKEVLESNGIYSISHIETINPYIFIEITNKE